MPEFVTSPVTVITESMAALVLPGVIAPLLLMPPMAEVALPLA